MIIDSEETTSEERGASVEGDLQEAFGTEGMSGKEMFMWYAVYSLIQALLAITLQFFTLAEFKKFYWQAILQIGAFLPVGLLWVLSLFVMNDLVVKMIEIALDWSFFAPFILHWLGFGMLTIGVTWSAWLEITLWVLYFFYGAGEIFLTMMFAPSIWEWIEADPLQTTTTTLETQEEPDVISETSEDDETKDAELF